MATRTLPVPSRAPAAPLLGDRAVVRAEHLTKRFGDVVAVDDLSFALERGTVTGFLGPNGAGKTTTLRMLLHLVEPTHKTDPYVPPLFDAFALRRISHRRFLVGLGGH